MRNYYKEASYIHYSNCHEDAEFALQHINGSPRRILTIASALDNALAFLLLDPDCVVAFDFNETQIYLCKLKKAGIEHLDYASFLTLIGYKKGDSGAIYNGLREYLDADTRAYFDSHLYLITDAKLIHCGRFEYYFRIFRDYILRFTHSKKTRERFFFAESLEQQRERYQSEFDKFRFRLLFRIFFSKAVMKRLGRDKEFFKYAKGSLTQRQKKSFETCVQNTKNIENPYLQMVVLEDPVALPAYLKEENFRKIKKNIHRLQIKKASFEEELNPAEPYDFMYLSDIFEYMSAEKTAQLSNEIYDALSPKGQVLFYNMMNERRLLPPFKETEIDQTMNRAFYYCRCLHYEKS